MSAAACVHGETLSHASVERVTGIKRAMWDAAGLQKAKNAKTHASAFATAPEITFHNTVPWKRVWKWFHSAACTKTEIDKQTKRQV